MIGQKFIRMRVLEDQNSRKHSPQMDGVLAQ